MSRVRGQSSGRGPVDWVWGGLGLAAAAMSTSFAGYMLAYGPVQVDPQGSPDFTLFAHVRPRTHAAWAGTTLPPAGASDVNRSGAARDATPGASAASAVDFTPTGTVPVGHSPNGETTLPVGKAAAAHPSTALPSFKVRDVFDGKALVESRTGLALAAPGSVLDGAGEVLSIERRGNNWVVVTTRGLIGEH